jgi:hypothetical protein
MTHWIEPPNPGEHSTWWLTRREADVAPDFKGGPPLPDIEVCWDWDVQDRAWIKGWTRDRQNREQPHLVCLHANNGWRLGERKC